MPVRILIADDNPTLRLTLRQFLEGADHWEILEAADGQEAVARALEHRPNIVVLDLAMPVKDGLTAAQEISSLLPETPILMYTMHNSPHLDLEARKSGVRTVVSKSNSALLVATIRQALAPEKLDQAAVPATTPPPVAEVDPIMIPPAPASPAEEIAIPAVPPPPKDVA
jgi:DNA-binding NarL/FixJ family response regulator